MPVLFLFLVLLLAPGVTAASAQSARPERPYRGLFGSGFGETDHSLLFNGSLSGGYDDNVLAGSGQTTGGVQDPRRARAGRFGAGSAGLTYALARGRLGLGASARGTTSYYPGRADEATSSYGANARLTMQLHRTTPAFVTQQIAVQPQNLLDLFGAPGGENVDPLPIADDDTAIGTTYYRVATTTAGLSHRRDLGRRSSLEFSYTYGHRRTSLRDARYDTHSARAGYRREIAEGLALRAGFRYTGTRSAGVSVGRRLGTHDIDAGLDYSRALSFSRRTTLSFSTGSRAVTDGDRTRFRALGNVRLAHEIGRTWNAWAAYDRNVSFIDAFDQPLDADAATGGLDGLLTRRIQFTSSVRASYGRFGLAGGPRYDTVSGTAGLSIAINRFLAAGASYVFHRYTFGDGLVLPEGVSRHRQRHGIRGQLTLSAPLFHQVRRPNAAR